MSDTHLGYSGFDLAPLVEDASRPGVMVRQRALDIVSGLAAAIDTAIESSADLVVHSGDLFDSARPSAHMVNVAMTEFKRLTAVGIPAIVIEGNNSYPRDRALGHPLSILGHLPGVHVICEAAAVVTIGAVAVHAYPYQALSVGAWPEHPPAVPTADVHLLLAHGVADGHPFFRGDRPAPFLSVKAIAPWFQYIALGQYNRHAQVPETENAFYAGATAMVGWADHRPGHTFSVVRLDVGKTVSVSTVALPTRTMRSYGLDDADGLGRGDVLELLSKQEALLASTGANSRVVVDGLEPLVRREISIRDVEAIFAASAALQVSLRARDERWDAVRAELARAGTLYDRFGALVGAGDGDGDFKQAVMALGTSLLDEAEEQALSQDASSKGARE